MQNNQRGGIASFVIVTVALAGLLVGALYFSKQQGRTARDNAPAPQVTQRDESAQEETADDQPAADNGDTSEQSPDTNGAAPAGEEAAPTSGDSSTSQPSGGTDRVATTGPSDDIPATGPTETVVSIVAASGLAFAIYKLAGSRRGLRSSALRK